MNIIVPIIKQQLEAYKEMLGDIPLTEHNSVEYSCIVERCKCLNDLIAHIEKEVGYA